MIYLSGTLGEEVMKDLEGVYPEGGFGVEFDIAENFFGDFVSDGSVKGNEHGLGEGGLHETLYHRIVIANKWLKITGFGTETKGNSQFQQEAEMEIAEVGLNGIQQEDVPFTPFI